MKKSTTPSNLILAQVWLIVLAVVVSTAGSLSAQDDKKPDAELNWSAFDVKEYDRRRFDGPTVVVIMRDLCAGCRAKRDALWNDKQVIAAVQNRKMILFRGNAQTEKGLAEQTRKVFGVDDLPVVILRGKSMTAKPIIVSGLPEPKQILKVLEKQFPTKGQAAQDQAAKE